MSEISLSVLVSEPDHFRVIEISGPDSQRLKQIQDIVGGYFEVLSAAFDSWCLMVNEDGKREGLPVNRPATRFADVMFVDAGRSPLSIMDYLSGPVVVTGMSISGDDRDTPTHLIRKYADCALLDAHVVTEASGFISLIRVRHDKSDDIYVYDQGDSRITDEVLRQVRLARPRIGSGQAHGEIEVWPAITLEKWVELRVELMDHFQITLHDHRDDRSFG